MLFLVSKRVSFEAAHFLPDYPGKCRNTHGHHWEVEVEVSGELGSDGMVIDFGVLSNALETAIEGFDHHLLNDQIINPTAENIAVYVLKGIKEYMRLYPGVSVESVSVWESEDSYVRLVNV